LRLGRSHEGSHDHRARSQARGGKQLAAAELKICSRILLGHFGHKLRLEDGYIPGKSVVTSQGRLASISYSVTIVDDQNQL
jgi:hypothetical protein